MPLDEFFQKPADNSHSAYVDSIFSFVAPEHTTGEVLLGSTYRKLLLGKPDASIDLEKINELPDLISPEHGGPEVWKLILFRPGGIGSPSLGGQTGARVLPQLMPLVPQIALNACVLGKVRSRWYPANLLLEVIGAGAGKTEGDRLIKSLGAAIEVNGEDDLFARFVALALERAGQATPPRLPYLDLVLEDKQTRCFRGDLSNVSQFSPAERFCKDLLAVMKLKPQLTRRQWTVLLESLLRIGLGMHVLWFCHVNSICWELALSVAAGNPVPTPDDVQSLLWQSHRESNPLLEVGGNATQMVRRSIERYVHGRFGLNLLIHKLDDAGQGWPNSQPIGASSVTRTSAPAAIVRFLEHVADRRFSVESTDPAGWLRSKCAEIIERNSKLVQFHSGFTRNMYFFVRHSLGQINPDVVEQVSYDQAYLLMGKGRSGRLIVQPGPATLILLVHACCYSQQGMPSSLEDLRLHFADYGLHIPAGEFASGRSGADLEKLGLVVDSPDAAGGRLLVPPFQF